METVKFKAVIDSEYFNNSPHLRIDVNGDILADIAVSEEMTIEKDLQLEDDHEYKLNFTLYDKSKYDTVLEDDNIVKDTVVKIKQVELDGVDITTLLPIDKEKFYYIHDGSTEKHTFYDTMGVNGTSTIELSSPFYVWLLENL